VPGRAGSTALALYRSEKDFFGLAEIDPIVRPATILLRGFDAGFGADRPLRFDAWRGPQRAIPAKSGGPVLPED